MNEKIFFSTENRYNNGPIKFTEVTQVIKEKYYARELYEYKGFVFELCQIKEDRNGNPMYKIIPFNFDIKILKGKIVRTMSKTNRGYIQSCHIHNTIKHIFS